MTNKCLKNKYVSIIVWTLFLGALFVTLDDSFYFEGWHLESKQEVRPGSGAINLFIVAVIAFCEYVFIAVFVRGIIILLYFLYDIFFQKD